MTSASPADLPTDGFHRVSSWLAVAAAIFAGLNLLWWSDRPLLEDHSLRQAQTAMNAFWMANGSPLFAYHRPIHGPPFAAPLEFPLYQWLVALLHSSGVGSLDASGRFVSFIFFAATVIPLRMIWRELGGSARVFPALAALFLLSPTYMHWGRAFLIESLSLWLALLYLAFLMRFLRSRSTSDLVAMTVAGCLAVAVKVTTYVGVFVAASAFTVNFLWPHVRRGELAAIGRPMAALAVAHALQFACLVAWLGYADAVRALGPFSTSSMGEAQLSWNFGYLADRITSAFLVVMPARALRDALGWVGPFVIVVAAIISRAWRDPRIIACVALFAVPPLIFPKLHAIHSYYQYENAFFLIVASAFMIDRLVVARRTTIALAALALLLVSQATGYLSNFAAKKHDSAPRILAIAAELRRLDTPTRHVLIVGTDREIEIAYYAEKRAVVAPARWSEALVARAIDIAKAEYERGMLDSVVQCTDTPNSNAELSRFIDEVTGGMESRMVGGCRLFFGRKAT